MLQLIPLRFGVDSQEISKIDLLVRIEPTAPEKLPERPRLNLNLVLDRSGSMSGQKLEYTLLAARQAIESLLPEDRVSVVTFDDKCNILIPSTPVTNKKALLRALEGVHAGSNTALHAGWLEGATQAAKHLDPGMLNRVLLLTDGEANVGMVEPDAISTDVHGLSQRGVTTSTLGFGAHYNENLLRAMAASGDGNHYFVESPSQLAEIFEVELGGLMATVGQKVRLRVESPGGIKVRTKLEQEGGRLRLNDLVLGNPLSVLLRLKVPPGVSPQATVQLEYFDMASKRILTQAARLELPPVSTEEWHKLSRSPLVLQEMALYEAAKAREKATAALDRRDEVEARRVLEAAVAVLEEMPGNDVISRHMAELRELLQDIAQRKHAEARKRSMQQERGYYYGSVSASSLGDVKEALRKAQEQSS